MIFDILELQTVMPCTRSLFWHQPIRTNSKQVFQGHSHNGWLAAKVLIATAMTLVAFFISMLVLISISCSWLLLGTILYVVLTVCVGSKDFNSDREIRRTEAITNTMIHKNIITDFNYNTIKVLYWVLKISATFLWNRSRNQDLNNKAIAASMIVFQWLTPSNHYCGWHSCPKHMKGFCWWSSR